MIAPGLARVWEMRNAGDRQIPATMPFLREG
jgi:hypothetical protein